LAMCLTQLLFWGLAWWWGVGFICCGGRFKDFQGIGLKNCCDSKFIFVSDLSFEASFQPTLFDINLMVFLVSLSTAGFQL